LNSAAKPCCQFAERYYLILDFITLNVVYFKQQFLVRAIFEISLS
jgi:hypothetical protein